MTSPRDFLKYRPSDFERVQKELQVLSKKFEQTLRPVEATFWFGTVTMVAKTRTVNHSDCYTVIVNNSLPCCMSEIELIRFILEEAYAIDRSPVVISVDPARSEWP